MYFLSIESHMDFKFLIFDFLLLSILWVQRNINSLKRVGNFSALQFRYIFSGSWYLSFIEWKTSDSITWMGNRIYWYVQLSILIILILVSVIQNHMFYKQQFLIFAIIWPLICRGTIFSARNWSTLFAYHLLQSHMVCISWFSIICGSLFFYYPFFQLVLIISTANLWSKKILL